jgi:hypothetical protein
MPFENEIAAGRAAMPDEPKRIRDGGPAFPVDHNLRTGYRQDEGMTLRDWFAGQALAGMLARGNMLAVSGAEAAYQYADAMLAERGA